MDNLEMVPIYTERVTDFTIPNDFTNTISNFRVNTNEKWNFFYFSEKQLRVTRDRLNEILGDE